MNLNKMKFLVIDDDTVARETVVEFLIAAGFENVAECSDGMQGLEAIKTNSVDFVICDWEMPEMDGLELVKEIRTIPQYQNLPFMMITNPISNEKLKVVDAAENGVDAYLIKPFRARVLIHKIHEIFYKRLEEAKKTVVIVDDDDDVRDYVTEVLTDMGFDPVCSFTKANDAFQFLEKNYRNVALVVSDWEMPGMTGIEFLHKVRINRRLAHLPFIIITSQTSVEHLKVQKAIEAEVDSYLMKPFRTEILQTKIRLVLTKSKLNIAITLGLEGAASAAADLDWADAERSYKHVRALDPKNIEALLGLARVELRRSPFKGFEEAIKYIEKAIEINPRYDRPHVELALAYELSRSIEKAIGVLRDALSQCFPQDQIHFQLGRMLIQRGKKEEGLQQLEKALELNPKHELADSLLKETEESMSKKRR